MKRFALTVVLLAATLLLGGCTVSTDGTGGPRAPGETPTPTPAENRLTSAEQVSLAFVAGAVPDLEGMFRKERRCVAALVAEDTDSAMAYLDSMASQVDRLGKEFDSFPYAGGRVGELEVLWDAVAGDFRELMDGLSAVLKGEGTKKADAAGTAYRADVKMLKSELDAMGATY